MTETIASAGLAGVFQQAQDAALRGSVRLREAMGLTSPRIFVTVPVNAVLPYVVVGEDQVPEAFDGDCAEELELFATVHGWSKPNPPQALMARKMTASIKAAMLGIEIPGAQVVEAIAEDERYLTDPDHSTHSVQVFRYLVTIPT